MWFPHPVTVMCLNCGQPSVLAETALGSVRVHCGTWRSQCDISAAERRARYAKRSALLTAPDATTDQELAA